MLISISDDGRVE